MSATKTKTGTARLGVPHHVGVLGTRGLPAGRVVAELPLKHGHEGPLSPSLEQRVGAGHVDVAVQLLGEVLRLHLWSSVGMGFGFRRGVRGWR